jgi:hypothetical protein
VEPSRALHEAIDRFKPFLVTDDAARPAAMSGAHTETIRDLVLTITPLFEEINALLDALVSSPHPLPEKQALLEEQLNSLGQAAMEARFELGLVGIDGV